MSNWLNKQVQNIDVSETDNKLNDNANFSEIEQEIQKEVGVPSKVVWIDENNNIIDIKNDNVKYVPRCRGAIPRVLAKMTDIDKDFFVLYVPLMRIKKDLNRTSESAGPFHFIKDVNR
eukprot:231808_1